MCVLADYCLILISTKQTPLHLNSTWCYDFMQPLLVLEIACVKQNPSSPTLFDLHHIEFLDHLFLHLYLKLETSPKPHLHLFKNSETW
jgi:hypothetical protein